METTIKTTNNNQVRNAYWAYRNRSKARTIYGAYIKPSSKKVEAFKYCMNDMVDYNGHEMRIVHAGSHFFSCGFMFEKNGKRYFRYHTASKVQNMEV